jgi:hypothetical protein
LTIRKERDKSSLAASSSLMKMGMLKGRLIILELLLRKETGIVMVKGTAMTKMEMIEIKRLMVKT